MKTKLERFLRFIPERPLNQCWVYQGTKNNKGYGSFGWGSAAEGKEMAHRASWRLFRGEIPKGLWVLHRCDNPPCVNPIHLFLGTQADNMRDASKKGRLPGPPRKEICRKGLHRMNGNRYCKQCCKIRDRKRWLKTHPKARIYNV